ncbi:hypothetical protein AGMMS49960_22040 [Betaproteobacteria bacterium]|nr:hypothetical protein AGMMS49543_25960 [Betaproteobacteria bacterium]GHU05586.1 hypothetical protein AGMMS49960_22040 [Betaproteobacteria bacterium]GHU23731.1 hypothetical protein AGMMS50243_25670 [Betaproteobacteria bacterium]
MAAGRRCLRVAAEVGGTVLLIDAKDERAAAWYARYVALPLLDAPLSTLLPLDLMAEALKSAHPPTKRYLEQQKREKLHIPLHGATPSC